MSGFVKVGLVSRLGERNHLGFVLISVKITRLSLILFKYLPHPFGILTLFFGKLSLNYV